MPNDIYLLTHWFRDAGGTMHREVKEFPSWEAAHEASREHEDDPDWWYSLIGCNGDVIMEIRP